MNLSRNMSTGDALKQSPGALTVNGTSTMAISTVEPMLTEDETVVLLFIFMRCIIPLVGCFGIVGNIFSICVLLIEGLDKSYNILLISLAFADTSFLTPLVISGLASWGGFTYPTDKNSFEFIFYRLLLFFDYSGAYTSMTIPMFITFERLVVMFFPLHFHKIINPKTTFCAVVCVYGVMWTINLHDVITDGMTANFDNVTLQHGLIGLSIQRNSMDPSKVKILISNVLLGPFPITFVVLGCFILAIKLKLTSIQRKKMTNKMKTDSSATSRVTLTLLVVCCVYTMTSLEAFVLYNFILQPGHLQTDTNGMFKNFLGELNNLIIVINCSVNFLIYVFINQKFRATFIEMMTKACCCSKSGN